MNNTSFELLLFLAFLEFTQYGLDKNPCPNRLFHTHCTFL
nr:MAG TPA: hypothetical protein [Caudoviricetes sp.]